MHAVDAVYKYPYHTIPYGCSQVNPGWDEGVYRRVFVKRAYHFCLQEFLIVQERQKTVLIDIVKRAYSVFYCVDIFVTSAVFAHYLGSVKREYVHFYSEFS